MKLARSDVIAYGEQRLIQMIAKYIDTPALEKAIKVKYGLSLDDNISFTGGDLVIHKNQIAYRIDFNLSINLSVIFDRQGRTMAIKASRPPVSSNDKNSTQQEKKTGAGDAGRSVEAQSRRMAADIARMISEINEQ